MSSTTFAFILKFSLYIKLLNLRALNFKLNYSDSYIAPSVGEMSPVSEEPSEEITDYPLFTSCFEALDLENRNGKLRGGQK